MDCHKKLNNIIKLRDELKTARSGKCTCTGFVLQYEQGCQCKKGDDIHKAEINLNQAIDEL